MFEQDYIMRQIQQILKVLVKVLFNVDSETITSSLIQDTETRETADYLLRKIDSGNTNEAEQELFTLTENNTLNSLLLGIVFYSHLNEKDDEYLENSDFSRDKVENGIRELLLNYGLEDISNIFFDY
ncbi:MAG: hypothetical protein K2I06_03795 [Ruminococcus sp.]|nr:hypothetical protein [Ruminococcus sp.]